MSFTYSYYHYILSGSCHYYSYPKDYFIICKLKSYIIYYYYVPYKFIIYIFILNDLQYYILGILTLMPLYLIPLQSSIYYYL